MSQNELFKKENLMTSSSFASQSNSLPKSHFTIEDEEENDNEELNDKEMLANNHFDEKKVIIMKTTLSSTPPFPYLPVFFVCFGMLAHGISFTSPFPYVAFMVVDFHLTSNLDSAGYYAGLITGMFMIGRSFAGLLWGIAADKYGRKICMCISMFNVMFFTLLFGFSFNFLMAILVRFCLGLGNGLLGIAKTYLSECVFNNKEYEMMALGYLNGAYSFGLIIGPVIGGLLSRPMIQYPHLFHKLLIFQTFPYLLPCLISAFIAALAGIGIFYFVPETLEFVSRSSGSNTTTMTKIKQKGLGKSEIAYEKVIQDDVVEEDLEMVVYNPTNTPEETLTQSPPLASTTTSPSLENEKRKPSTLKEILSDKPSQQQFIIYMALCFITMFSDEIFPLYAVTSIPNGGLAWETSEVGQTLAWIGLSLVIFQLFFFKKFMNYFFSCGQKEILVRTFRIHTVTITLLPLFADWTLRFLQYYHHTQDLNTKRNPFLFVAVIFSLLCFRIPLTATFTSLTMVVNSCVDSKMRGTLNGLMMTAGKK